jgi:isoprenylcysteine carboxyl methyltransferase (ICMT) family protein YpbQ
VFSACNAVLLTVRIRTENRALAALPTSPAAGDTVSR